MRDLEHLRRRYADHVPGLLGARHSYAVLCPLVERPDGLHLLFEVRSAALHRQPGEVCFPGGRMEAGETPEQCALRETEEELAIPRQEVEVLGRPDFICNQAGFLMQPVLGLVSAAGFAAVAPPLRRWERHSPSPWLFFGRPLRSSMSMPCSRTCRGTFPMRPWGFLRTTAGPGAGWRSPSGIGRATPSGV